MSVAAKPILACKRCLGACDHVASRRVAGEFASEVPELTIAIPTFRRPELLREAVASALNQRTARRFEVIVVDNDAEADDRLSAELAAGFDDPRLIVFRNAENIGMFGNWNRCITLARTRWLTLLNDDDRLHDGFVETVLAALDGLRDAALLQTGYDIDDFRAVGTGAPRRDAPPVAGSRPQAAPLDLSRIVLMNDRAGSLGIVYRSDVLRDAGGFDADEYPSADYCLNVRIVALGGRGYAIADRLATYRILANESFRPAVLAGFVVNDYRLRMEVAERLHAGWLLRRYARWNVAPQIRSLQAGWGVRVDAEALRRGLPFEPALRGVAAAAHRLLAALLRRLIRARALARRDEVGR